MMRINKYLASCGICSRRNADDIISSNRVKINDEYAQLGSVVQDGDIVKFDDKIISLELKHRYYKLNKPVGIECTSNLSVKDNIIDFVNLSHRVFTVGRLDKNSQGLILLTDDGEFANFLIKGRFAHEKEYEVRVNKPINREFLEGMSNGVPILDTITRECRISQISKYEFRIVITQGLNRQIRRMCEYFGYKVLQLKRIRIGNLHLGDLKSGELKPLSETEVAQLKKLIGGM